MPLLEFQGIGSGVYLHIRQHLLASTAVSLAPFFLYGILSEDIFLSVMAFTDGDSIIVAGYCQVFSFYVTKKVICYSVTNQQPPAC